MTHSLGQNFSDPTRLQMFQQIRTTIRFCIVCACSGLAQDSYSSVDLESPGGLGSRYKLHFLHRVLRYQLQFRDDL